MVLGIMQPYFMPYLGYFALMKHTDKWVSLDTVQYIQRGWVNRNAERLESVFITVSLAAHGRETLIKDIATDPSCAYIGRIMGQLEGVYKKRAPYYKETCALVLDCLKEETRSLSALNEKSLQKVCAYLGFPVDFNVFSHMDLPIDPIESPGDWALNISRAMGATTYLNPIGGLTLFDESAFEKAGIRLRFMRMDLPAYNQRKAAFIPSLSVVDALMFNSPAEVSAMLDCFSIIKQDGTPG